MKKIIIFLTILLSSSLNIAFSQTAKVTSEDVSQAELERQKNRNQWIDKSQEYLKLRSSLNLPDGNRKFPFENFDSKTQIERAINQSSEILRKINLNPKLWILAKEVDGLANRVGENSNYYSKLNAQIKNAENNVQNGKNRLSELEKKQQAKVQHNKQMLDLDNELQGLKKQSASIDKALATHQTKSKSIDDFLASKTSTKTNNNQVDFLANDTKTISKTTDFLSGSSSTDDFISNEPKKENYNIEYKDGKQGVISSTGKLLIPFKNWKIIEYKGGIAKVEIHLSSYKCDGIQNGIVANKEGLVDDTGKFLDGYEIRFKDMYFYPKHTGLKLVKFGSVRDYEAEEREKRELKIKRQKCNNDIKEWRLRILRQYQQ